MVELIRAAQSSRLPLTKRQDKFQKLVKMLGRREEMLQKSYECNISTVKISKFAASYSQEPGVFVKLPNFLEISKAPLKAVLTLGQTEKRLYDSANDILVDVHVSKNKFVFCNTKVDDWINQSWGRPQDAGVLYHDFGVLGYRDKSKFDKGVLRWTVAMAAFNDPVGVLRSENQIWLYVKFKKSIGTLPGTKVPTAWARVQCDRVKRSNGTGYCTHIHGYPVSETEVKNDLSKCKTLFSLIEKNLK